MNTNNLQEIKDHIINNFEKYGTYQIENNNKFICFISKNLDIKRDESDLNLPKETEICYGIDEKGWLKHTKTMISSCGPSKLINTSYESLSSDEVLDLCEKDSSFFLKLQNLKKEIERNI